MPGRHRSPKRYFFYNWLILYEDTKTMVKWMFNSFYLQVKKEFSLLFISAKKKTAFSDSLFKYSIQKTFLNQHRHRVLYIPF